MKIVEYIKDKWFSAIMRSIFLTSILLIMTIFGVPYTVCVIFGVMYLLIEGTIFVWEMLRRKRFYDMVAQNTELLDKKYLVLETLQEPSFYEGKLMCQILYDINKSMCENVNQFKKSMVDFKEYIEMWVHEVKIPLASLRLMYHNNKETMDKKWSSQLRRIDNYTEQVLYYVRSEHTEKDFLIKEINLGELIKNVAIHQKDDLLDNQIELYVEHNHETVMTDGKWLEFILNQIMNNAIKYRDSGKESHISISVDSLRNKTVLHVEDNGVGISQQDLGRVFEKSFTGENGRAQAKSTGMGLYIAKKLCDNLGHKIEIESKKDSYTKVSISFAQNDFYKM